MTMKKTALTLAAAALLLPSLAMAKDCNKGHGPAFNYTGPVANLTTVAEGLEKVGSFNDIDVVLEGKLIKQINKKTFLFEDETGTINVELERRIRLPKDIDENTKVRIYGELEGGSNPEVEADFIKLI